MQRAAAALLAALAFVVAGAAPTSAGSADLAALRLVGLSVTNGGAPFAGDRRLLTTITPNGDGLRDRAGADARRWIATDASELEVQFFRSGPEFAPTRTSDEMRGYRVSPSIDLDWRWPDRPQTLPIRLPNVPSGFYFARLTASDGRV